MGEDNVTKKQFSHYNLQSQSNHNQKSQEDFFSEDLISLFFSWYGKENA